MVIGDWWIWVARTDFWQKGLLPGGKVTWLKYKNSDLWLGKSAAKVEIPNFRARKFHAMPKLDEQLKAAIARMPVAEKDKMLLRLVAKDEKLVRRLVFELMEGGETRDERAAALREEIAADLAAQARDYLTPGYLLLYLRHWNARINEHVLATKDKSGEVSLVLFMLAEAFRLHHEMLQKFPERRSDTFAPYVVKRTATILGRAKKLHEDYFMEFRRDAQELLEHIWAFRPTAVLAEEQGLPRYWAL